MGEPIQKNIELTKEEYEDLKTYCKINKLEESKILKKSFVQGYQIVKYGLLSNDPKPIIQEVIKEIEVERIVEVEKIVEITKEIPVERIVEVIKEIPSPPKEIMVTQYVDREVIKEVPVEKIVEKIVNIHDNSQVDVLVRKIEELENRPPVTIEIVKEVIVEVPKEIIVEVPKEVIVEMPIKQDETKMKMLEETLHNLRLDNLSKDKKINELQNKLSEISNSRFNMGAVYLRGSNLDETLLK